MPTPSIQTLVTDAQQILNLDSISAVRSVVAVALANANTGTPLNPNLTTQQLWNEFYQVVNKPKSDIESIIANQLMKFLFAPPAPGGVGANGQVIFNDGGVLAGDPQFLWNKTTNLLTVTGSATITGDLTVDTSTLKVDSANNRVGIGTASPGYLLDVQAATAVANILSTTGTNTAYLQISNTGGYFYLGRENSAGTTFAAPAYSAVLYAGGAYPLVTTVNGGERYRIASDGVATWSNVGGVAGTAMTLNSTGLGVGTSPIGKFDVYNTGADTTTFIRSDTTRLGQIVFRDNADSANQGRVKYDHSTDTLSLFSGGNENVFLSSSGNLGLGVTPSAWAASFKALQVGIGGCVYSRTADQTQVGFGSNVYFDATDNRFEYVGTGQSALYRQDLGVHQWFIAPSGTADTAITFTQAMTLDTSGNLLVGKTATGLTVGVMALATGVVESTMASSTSAQSTLNVYSTGAAAYRFYVGMNGTINATNTTISAISDARLKENVQDIDVGLGAILALKPRKFDWKAGKGKDIKGDRGFIAQEFETVFPNLIDEWKDAAPTGEAPYKSVRQDLIPVLVKAIQELTARVQTLETR